MRISRYAILFITAAWTLLTAIAADPYMGYIYPSAVTPGTTNKLLVGGQNFYSSSLTGCCENADVEVLSIERVPSFPYPDTKQRKYLQNWLDAIARGTNDVPALPELKSTDAWRTNRWWTSLNTLGERERAIVTRDLWVRRNPLQDAPALKQLLLVTLRVRPDAKPGRRFFRLYATGAVSAPRPFEVVPHPVVEEPFYVPPSRPPAKPPRVTLPVVLVGQILPGETDRFVFSIAAGQRVCLSVAARSLLPYIGDAVPGFFNPVVRLVNPEGCEVAFADDCRGFDPDPSLEYVASRAGDYTLEIHDCLYRGREDFVYSITLGEMSRPTHKPAGVRTLPFETNLVISTAGPKVVEAFSRRLGSKADVRMRLYAPDGALLSAWDDVTNTLHVGTMMQAELDPRGVYDFRSPGVYRLVVEDACGRSGQDLFARVELRPPKPQFSVVAERSGFHMTRGERFPFTVFVDRREGFDGPITLVETDEVRFENAIIPPGTNAWRVLAIGKHNEWNLPARMFGILAVGETDGTVIGSRIIAADAYDQAFAWRHYVPFGPFFYKCRYVPVKPAAKPKDGKGTKKK